MKGIGGIVLSTVLMAMHLPAVILLAAFYVDIPGAGALLLVSPLLQAVGVVVMLLACLISKAARDNAVAWGISGLGLVTFALIRFHVARGF